MKKYKKTSRLTSALDTSVMLESVLIVNYYAYCIIVGYLYTFKPEHGKKGQLSSALILFNFRSITQVSIAYHHTVNSSMPSSDFGYPYIGKI